MKKIQVYGKEYPMRMTMGAMRRFKQETGMEVSEMTTEASLMVVFLFCCVASACNADKFLMLTCLIRKILKIK